MFVKAAAPALNM